MTVTLLLVMLVMTVLVGKENTMDLDFADGDDNVCNNGDLKP